MATSRNAVVLAVVLGAASAAGAAGCGVKDRTQASLTLVDSKITIAQPDGVTHELVVFANGLVQWDGKPLVTISKTGVLRDGNRVLAKVDKYGAMAITGQPTNLAVRPDGTFVLDGEVELSIAREGQVLGPLIDSLDHPAVVLEGSTIRYLGPVAGRQVAMLGLVALVVPQLAPALPPAPAPPTSL